MKPYDLVGAADRLFDLLEERQVDYVLVGGMAMLKHGEMRNSPDIDMIVTPDSVSRLSELELVSQEAGILRTRFERVPLDLLLTSDPVFHAVHARLHMTSTYGSRQVRCASAARMFLLKVYAVAAMYRATDRTGIHLHELDLLLMLTTSPGSADKALIEMRRLFHSAEFALMQRIVGTRWNAFASGNCAASNSSRISPTNET